MCDWNSLTWEEKLERNKSFLKEFPVSDSFGSIKLLKNGRDLFATITGSARANHFPLWDAFKLGQLPQEYYLGTPEFYKSARPLDFINHFSLGGTDTIGWFMSKKTKNVFERFHLGNHRFYPITITKNEQLFEYFLLAVKTEDDSSIDFPRSSFYFGNNDTDFQYTPTECSSLEEYHKYMSSREYENTVYIGARNIVLNKKFDKSKDIIYFDLMMDGPFLSKRLITSILENKLTGISVHTESNVHLN